jgi:type III secretory pathway component EscV
MPKQIPLTAELLALTEKSYDEYNTVLTEIMTRLPFEAQVQTFQRVLEEELPLTTARRAYRTAVRVAMGEEDIFREYQPKPVKPHKKARK